jgi:hypothetical protein
MLNLSEIISERKPLVAKDANDAADLVFRDIMRFVVDVSNAKDEQLFEAMISYKFLMMIAEDSSVPRAIMSNIGVSNAARKKKCFEIESRAERCALCIIEKYRVDD